MLKASRDGCRGDNALSLRSRWDAALDGDREAERSAAVMGPIECARVAARRGGCSPSEPRVRKFEKWPSQKTNTPVLFFCTPRLRHRRVRTSAHAQSLHTRGCRSTLAREDGVSRTAQHTPMSLASAPSPLLLAASSALVPLDVDPFGVDR